jgi:hypothetical protein
MSPSEGGGIGRRTSGGSHLERMASLVDYSSSDESEGDAWHPNPGDPHHHHTNAGDDRFDEVPRTSASASPNPPRSHPFPPFAARMERSGSPMDVGSPPRSPAQTHAHASNEGIPPVGTMRYEFILIILIITHLYTGNFTDDVFCLLVYIQLQPGISFVHLAAGPFTVGIRVTSTPAHRDERRALTHRVTRRVVGVQAGVQARREQTRSHRRSRQPIIFNFVFDRSILRDSVDGHAGFAPALRLLLPERRGNDDDGWGVGWSSTTRVSGRWVPTGFTESNANAKHKSIAKSNANAKHNAIAKSNANAKHNAIAKSNAIAERTRKRVVRVGRLERNTAGRHVRDGRVDPVVQSTRFPPRGDQKRQKRILGEDV